MSDPSTERPASDIPTAEDPTTAPTVGQTGGLPGANAAPEASELSDDEAADTVNSGETAPLRDADRSRVIAEPGGEGSGGDQASVEGR